MPKTKRGSRGGRAKKHLHTDQSPPELGAESEPTRPRPRLTVDECVECAGIPRVEVQCLFELYQCTNGDGWNNNANWLTDRPAVEWKGVQVRRAHGNGCLTLALPRCRQATLAS